MVKAQHLYWVDFEPVRIGEFPNKHLAIVLELNADKKTCRVIPLTTKSNGLGRNKICLGKLHNFPDDSYAVLDQVRTIAINRMTQHYNAKNKKIDIKIPNEIFHTIKTILITREEINLSQINLMAFYSERLVELKKKHIVNLLYGIKKKSDGLIHIDDLSKNQELKDIKREIETQITYFVDIEDYISDEHPSLLELLKAINIGVVELNFETA